MASSLSFIRDIEDGGPSGCLIIRGASGTGKTYFCKEVLRRSLKERPEALCLYFDISDDEFTSSQLFQSLMFLSWNEQLAIGNQVINVPSGSAFLSFLRKNTIKDTAKKYLYMVVLKSVALIPTFGPAVKDLIPEELVDTESIDPTPDVAVAFFSYLGSVTKDRCVMLAIDNYQFLPASLRLLLEARARTMSNRFCLLCVDRTEGSTSTIDKPSCFQDNQLKVEIRPFGKSQVRRLFESVFDAATCDIPRLVNDAFLKTGGNLKEIEYYALAIGRGYESRRSAMDVQSFLTTIGKLPLLERSLLAVSSMFPAGIRIPHAIKAVQKLLSTTDADAVKQVIQELVAIGYLVVNTVSGETLKPAHEKIITAMRDCLTDEELLDIRESVIQAFDDLLSGSVDQREYTYLLHCLIGVLNFNEIRQRLDSLASLIDIQYRNHSFHYIVSLYQHFPDVVRYLPDSTVLALLDSFQKTSEFYMGMTALKKVKPSSDAMEESCRLFMAKYLVQTYKYAEALRILDSVASSDEALMCKLNALQCLGHDEVSRDLVRQISQGSPQSEEYHIILRNSAHLFPREEGLDNLLTAFHYFEQRGSDYGKATVLNNLGVAYLWYQESTSAERVLRQSRSLLDQIASAEVYQPLINLAVLEVTLGRPGTAMEIFNEAKRWVPRTLLLDHLLLDANMILTELARDSISPSDVIMQMRSLLAEARKIEDPRLHNQLAFSLNHLEALFAEDITASPQKSFVELIERKPLVGMEVIQPTVIQGSEFSILLILSPHWRH